MEQKRDFKTITIDIKKECLRYGYGLIIFDKDKEDLWIDDYENHLGTCVHADAIKIDKDIITLCEDGKGIVTFDHIHSIDRQIAIYDTIFEHRDQLSFYQLDWNQPFKAQRVTDDDGNHFVWRILTDEEAYHLWYNGTAELCRLHDDGTESMIEDEESFRECLGHTVIVVPAN